MLGRDCWGFAAPVTSPSVGGLERALALGLGVMLLCRTSVQTRILQNTHWTRLRFGAHLQHAARFLLVALLQACFPVTAELVSKVIRCLQALGVLCVVVVGSGYVRAPRPPVFSGPDLSLLLAKLGEGRLFAVDVVQLVRKAGCSRMTPTFAGPEVALGVEVEVVTLALLAHRRSRRPNHHRHSLLSLLQPIFVSSFG